MLNQNELAEYFQRNKLSAEAIKTINHIRTSEPERRVESGSTNVACHYSSKKMKMTIQAESHTNELAALVTWDFDDATREIYDQPQKVKLTYLGKNGRRSTHLSTPDYFLLQEGFAGWVECKPEKKLQQIADSGSELFVRDHNGKWRCPSGEVYAEKLGLKFIVRSSAENNFIYVRNLEFLADYFDVRCPGPEPVVADRVIKKMSEQAWVLLKSLIDCDIDADVIYKMIADNSLYFNMTQDLLSEPERTIIFRDKQAAEAYKIHIMSSQLPAISPSRALNIAVGQSFMWDGRAWKIINVGDHDIFMEDADKAITNLGKNIIEQMVKDGLITGLPEEEYPERLIAEQLVRGASPEDYEHALYRYHCIFPENTDESVTASLRAIRKWNSLYRHSAATYGSGFLGLLPKIHNRGNRNRKIDQKVIDIMDSVIEDHYAQPGGKSQARCWGEVSLQCEELGLVAPSEKTFKSQIERYSQNEIKVVREGEKAAYSESELFWRLELTTSRHGDRPFEIAHIDHTELDIQFVGSKRGENLQKAWLTVMIDANTRMVLAWVLMFDPPSYRSCMAVIRNCVKRHGRVPKTIIVDQGSEFKSTYFDCLIARLESHKKMRPGSKPRFGSIVERFFGINNQLFIHNLRGNNLGLQKPRSLSKSHDPRKLAVWTLPEFHEAFDGFLNKVYSKCEHSALGVSPEEAMAIGMKQSGIRKHVLIPYTRDFIIMCLPSTRKGTAKVEPSRGVKIGYIYYWTPEFRDSAYAKTDVEVRYDPFNMSVALVWLKNHWADCRSELAAEFEGRTEKEINNTTQELRARMKRDGTRRGINAQIIANYLRETTSTEQGLLNQQRQLDTQAASNLQVITSYQSKQLESAADSTKQDVWQNLTIKMIGEFDNE